MALRDPVTEAVHLMDGFAARTGLFPPAAEPERYLWTDAFAVCTYLEIFRRSGDTAYRERAGDLIDQVHRVLGRHRRDDPRSGWLSGLSEAEGAAHPTAGGLRIGKRLPERDPGQPLDDRLEWDRDGQYFHYLTKWMHALTRAARVLDEPLYGRWAVELAEAVVPRFLQVSPSGAPAGLIWKMSIDLTRPQVPAISPHDALDGFVTVREVRCATAAAALDREIDRLGGLCRGGVWYTDDPLGLGGLLFDAGRLAVLPDRTQADETLVGDLLTHCASGLRDVLHSRLLAQPAAYRLAFRELGLAIGLKALPIIADAAGRSPRLSGTAGRGLQALIADAGIGEELTAFWLTVPHRRTATWQEHRDINEVMLATALAPAQFLSLGAT